MSLKDHIVDAIDIVFSGIAFKQDGPVYYTFTTNYSFGKSFGTLVYTCIDESQVNALLDLITII